MESNETAEVELQLLIHYLTAGKEGHSIYEEKCEFRQLRNVIVINVELEY